MLHDKGEDVATFLTAKAVEGLSIWGNIKRWRFLLMEGAAGHKVAPSSFEGKVRADEVDDIDPSFDLSDFVTHDVKDGNMG